jgi:hypothetical protein
LRTSETQTQNSRHQKYKFYLFDTRHLLAREKKPQSSSSVTATLAGRGSDVERTGYVHVPRSVVVSRTPVMVPVLAPVPSRDQQTPFDVSVEPAAMLLKFPFVIDVYAIRRRGVVEWRVTSAMPHERCHGRTGPGRANTLASRIFPDALDRMFSNVVKRQHSSLRLIARRPMPGADACFGTSMRRTCA